MQGVGGEAGVPQPAAGAAAQLPAAAAAGVAPAGPLGDPQAATTAAAPVVERPGKSSARAAAAAAGPAPGRRGGRKGRGGRGGGAGAAEAAATPEELVKLGPEISRNSERLRTGWRPVQLSSEDKAAEIVLDERQLTASSSAGYRMARATHGAYQGTWYFEVRIDRLGPSGAARVGWCTRQAELNAPVGADAHGYSYRSLQGSKVHAGWRDDYGQPYGEGDVIGCLLHMPEGGRPFEKGVADVVRYKGKLYFTEEAGEPREAGKLAGSFVAFFRNGVLQGKAYTELKEGTYCPAVSLYTNRTQQSEPAAVTVNFGEQGFAFPPGPVEGCPQPAPVSDLPGPAPAAVAAAAGGAAAVADAVQQRAAGAAAQQQAGVQLQREGVDDMES